MKETYLIAIQLYEDAVRAGAPPDVCQCCGAHVAEGVKGCWELISELFIREYPDGRIGGAGFMGGDAHALQHPEIHGKKNNAAHLLRLCWIFERGQVAQAGTVPHWWQQYLQGSNNVPRLEPPSDRGPITVADVAAAESAQAAAALMEAWARSVYAAWHLHHDWARRELARLLP
jgi:hypothetical protein